MIEVRDFGDSTTDTVGGVNYFYHLRGVRGVGGGGVCERVLESCVVQLVGLLLLLVIFSLEQMVKQIAKQTTTTLSAL